MKPIYSSTCYFFSVRQVRKLGVADVRPETLAAILARTDIVLDTYYVSN